MEESRLREILADELERHESVSAAIHAEHHEFIKTMIAREKIKQERWEAIQKQVLGWGAIALISGIGAYMQANMREIVSAIFR